MPYEYRNLSARDKEEIIRQRREAGYPFHAPPHPFRDQGCYFLSASNYEHVAVMAMPDRRTQFEHDLLREMESIQAEVIGWVILPNHYHVLTYVESLDDVSAALHSLHGRTAYEWNKADQLTGKRRVWFRFSDRLIRDNQHYFCALNYIHINPVKHGYVNDPYDWPWMSLQTYVDEMGKDWLRRTWKDYPPDNFGKGWDD